MQYNFTEVAVAYFCGIAMPGPSIALLVRNGILYSRTSGISSAIGVIVGISLQSALVLIAVSFIDTKHSVFIIIKALCSMYLVYLGIKSFSCMSGTHSITKAQNINQKGQHYKRRCLVSFREGVLLEMLNPMAFTFFISIFTAIINLSASSFIKFCYWLEILLLGSVWFCGFAFLISIEKFIQKISRFFKLISLLSGIVFVLFGIQLLVDCYESIL